ncbi:alpha/beta hydrolase [Gordonia sp. L191]|uniref:alpha/beta hydrolase n=1 Tax=Gordonia sp. L191 TaxID=2982699 RepID=UPI0024C07539|nr:alpha/beta hydrolase [Gordonia sp. L191]WHU46522.1 alpha/beta hydrolase [Gordonia sp. L191]
MTRSTSLGSGRYLDTSDRPEYSHTTVHELTTADNARVHGVLTTIPGSTTVVTLMHPRADVTHHGMVNELLTSGVSVWTQHTRSPNNDLNLDHEQALLDVAAGMTFLRDAGFESVVTLGHSGGGTLYAYYAEQAGLPSERRFRTSPSGRPSRLGEADLPPADGTIFLAPHPGQGRLLLGCIDPSVGDEADPMSVIEALNAYSPRNGFAEPPNSSQYSEEFVELYRQAQYARVERLDTLARESIEATRTARAQFDTTGDMNYRRRSLAPHIMVVYRTDADLRTVDLHIDPNERPYGSVFGRRPDLINYGQVGFGRITTPEAWLSTWSGISSRADFVRCAAGVEVPTLFIELTGDQAAFPSDTRRMVGALAARDKTHVAVRGTHFGGPIAPGEPTGYSLAGEQIQQWLAARFPVVGIK